MKYRIIDTQGGGLMQDDIFENKQIEPLHYPKRGVSGEQYYKLEDQIISILSKRLK